MTAEELRAWEYILSLKDTAPELYEDLMKAALEAKEIEEDQAIIVAESRK